MLLYLQQFAQPGMVYYGRPLLFAVILPHVVRCFLQDPSNPARLYTSRSHAADILCFAARPTVRRQTLSFPPVIAVLRDVKVERVLDVARTVREAGFRMVSVTVDTSGFERIVCAMASDDLLEDVIVGASSVTTPEQVDAVRMLV